MIITRKPEEITGVYKVSNMVLHIACEMEI